MADQSPTHRAGQSYSDQRKDWIDSSLEEPFRNLARVIRKKGPNTKYTAFMDGEGPGMDDDTATKLEGMISF